MDLYIGRIFAGSTGKIKIKIKILNLKKKNFAGMTGGGMYICLPLFVAEVADQRLVYVQYQREPISKVSHHDNALVWF